MAGADGHRGAARTWRSPAGGATLSHARVVHLRHVPDRLNDRFTLAADGIEPRTVELVEATESPTNPGFEGRRVPFSVVFREPGPQVLPQQIYRLEHAGLGAFDLFIVPIARDGDGVRYEAVFT